MIKAEELRKGILINSKLLGTNHKVTGFISRDGKDFLYTDLQVSYSDLEDWQGITLTPEILEDAGFRNLEKIPFLLARVGNSGFNIYFKSSEYKSCNIAFINYVHQLQNLYFALTGKELEVNLTSQKSHA